MEGIMETDMMHDKKEMARLRHAYEHDARSRGLQKNWFVALVALWIVIWGFVGLSGVLPRPLWVAILALLVLSAFAIALFGPRNRERRIH
jgi:Flp pilus assembly protein TadB